MRHAFVSAASLAADASKQRPRNARVMRHPAEAVQAKAEKRREALRVFLETNGGEFGPIKGGGVSGLGQRRKQSSR